jgi:hypothetical protein
LPAAAAAASPHVAAAAAAHCAAVAPQIDAKLAREAGTYTRPHLGST